jgi:hypothetical protein
LASGCRAECCRIDHQHRNVFQFAGQRLVAGDRGFHCDNHLDLVGPRLRHREAEAAGLAVELCTKALDPIDADHIDIVKPENQNSMSYMAFKSAYADKTIPELNTLLHAASYRLRSEIEELVRFPNGTNAPEPRTMLELMLVDKLPQRIFERLSHYNKPEITGVPSEGEILYQYRPPPPTAIRIDTS